jgi:signal transduction histidine kinase
VNPELSESRSPLSLRTRFLAIAVVPSIVLLAAGIGLGVLLTVGVARQQTVAAQVERTADAMAQFLPALYQERRLSVSAAAPTTPSAELLAHRRTVDVAGARLGEDIAALTPLAPAGVQDELTKLRDAVAALPAIREQAQTGGSSGFELYERYDEVTDASAAAFGAMQVMGTDADVLAGFAAVASVLFADEAVDSTRLLADIAPGGLEPDVYTEYAALSAVYRHELGQAAAILSGPNRDRLLALLESREWQQLTAGTDALLQRGPAAENPAAEPITVEPPAAGPAATARSETGPQPAEDARPAGAATDAVPVIPAAEYQAAAATVNAVTTAIFADTVRSTASDAVERARTAFVATLLGALAALVVGVAIVTIGARMSTTLARRLERLRTDTLDMVEHQMPSVLERLRKGDALPADVELDRLDHGSDEIGQVARAFNTAQQVAVAAAVEEARTRAGAHAVFLNIARRSQAIVHRQLQVLDDAEIAERDPDQLARLFQLDHLATRERRNAEKLIIMGGMRPRRRWRRPVALADIVRSAISESEDYTRIDVGQLQRTFVRGSVVGDLIHLLAELVDNASSFSPPKCPINVRIESVGSGVAVEIVDRGLGIEREDRERLNQMLAEPPEFGMRTLGTDSRVGLFVVATLAARHGIRVRLMESAWSGVQAIVVIPTSLLTAEHADTEDVEPSTAGHTDDPLDEAEPPLRLGADLRAGVPAAQGTLSDRPEPATPTAATPTVADLAAAHADDDPDDGPELPERTPQRNIVAGLRDQPADGVAAGDPSPAADDAPAERSRAAMSALQRGARDGRNAAENGRNGRPA